MNSFGKNFRVSIFGESHGPCIGVQIEGFPAGLRVSKQFVQSELSRRAPGRTSSSSKRREPDRVKILSGVFRGKATGTPIVMTIANTAADSRPYLDLCKIPRPGHADFPAWLKYGDSWDWRGGGQFSGRITVGLVAAGALAKTLLERERISIFAHATRIGKVTVPSGISFSHRHKTWYVSEFQNSKILRLQNCKSQSANPFPKTAPLDLQTGCAFPNVARRMLAEIRQARKKGDTVGGVIECIIQGLPVGLGEPLFDTLDGNLAKMMFAIPAVKAIEFGAGFKCAEMKGSQHNDPYVVRHQRVVTTTNNAGGILGGMSTGMPVVFRVAIKPTSSISLPQKTLNLDTLEEQTIRVKGRHDPCIVPRAVPVIEAGTAIVIADLLL